MVKKQEKADYHQMADSVWDARSGEILYTEYVEKCIERHYQVEQKYLDSFTPVILAGGENIRMGPFPKPLQTIEGVPSVVRVINQLKSVGFPEKEVYVVTRMAPDYRGETYCFFENGLGKDMEVNNVTFREPLTKAEVIKRFADGKLEETKLFDTLGPTYKIKTPPLRKNLLVVAADNVLFSGSPFRLFVNKCGEYLSAESNGYVLLMMRNLERSRWERFKEAFDTFGYAFDREAYSQVDIPKKDVSVSNVVCENIKKNGKKGDIFYMGSSFFNINNPELYNMALKVRSSSKYRLDSPGDDMLDVTEDLKHQTSAEKFYYRLYWPVSIPHIGIKYPYWRGVYTVVESGLETYLEKCGWEPRERIRGDVFFKDFLDDAFFRSLCFGIGTLAFEKDSDIGNCLKAESKRVNDCLIEQVGKRAPELGEYIEKAIRFGKENRRNAENYARERLEETKRLKERKLKSKRDK